MPEMATTKLQMVDLLTQYQRIKTEIDDAIRGVLDSGQYILGKVVGEFECDVAGYLGVKYALGCASGTDALQIALMALDVKPGDEVITTPFTFVATTETIALLGAKPIYVDIDPISYNIDPGKIEAAVTSKTKAILPVHLYGHPTDMDPLMEIARKHGLAVIEDTAQAMGAEYKGRKVGGVGTIGCISFFPSKNLGAFGDAGMVVTNDERLAEKARIIAIHGSRVRYHHEMLGINSRLDSIQAAILKVKLRYLEQWHKARREAAAVYNRLLGPAGITLPREAPYARHIYHQYTIRVKNRDGVAQKLATQSIPHAIYYPIPLHLQEAYAHFGGKGGDFPAAEHAAEEVLSLPMHTELNEEQQAQIADAVLRALRS